MTAEETVTVKELVARVAKLERNMKRLRRKLRQAQPYPGRDLIDWTPELEAELVKEADELEAHPERGIPGDVFLAELDSIINKK